MDDYHMMADYRIGWVIVEKDKIRPLKTGKHYYGGGSCKLYKSEAIAKAALSNSYHAYNKDSFIVLPAFIQYEVPEETDGSVAQR